MHMSMDTTKVEDGCICPTPLPCWPRFTPPWVTNTASVPLVIRGVSCAGLDLCLLLVSWTGSAAVARWRMGVDDTAGVGDEGDGSDDCNDKGSDWI